MLSSTLCGTQLAPTLSVNEQPLAIINSRFSELEVTLADQAQLLQNLQERLEPILTPEPPASNGKSGGAPVPVPLQSRVAEGIAVLAERQRAMNAQIQRLISRVEV